MTALRCAGCSRLIEAGDRIIRDAPSAFIGGDTAMDGLLADVLGGRSGEVVFCEPCTQGGGRWTVETFDPGEYGPEATR